MNFVVIVEPENRRGDSRNCRYRRERNSNCEREVMRLYSCFHVGQVTGRSTNEQARAL